METMETMETPPVIEQQVALVAADGCVLRSEAWPDLARAGDSLDLALRRVFPEQAAMLAPLLQQARETGASGPVVVRDGTRRSGLLRCRRLSGGSESAIGLYLEPLEAGVRDLFTVSASDWLTARLGTVTPLLFWETDETLILQRFFGGARASASSLEAWLGSRLWELPVVGAKSDRDRLRVGMAQREELHDVVFSIHLGGRVTRWRLSGRPTFDPGGAFSGYRGSMLDETPLEDARRDAASRLEQFRSFIDMLPVAVLSWDASERVQWMNLEAQRLCGLEQLSVVGARVADLAQRVGLEPVTDTEAGGDPSLEPDLFEMRCADGVRRSFLHRPLAYNDGAGPRTASLFLDVTASRERSRLLERMGRMDAIGRFAGSIAHDLGNSMTVFEGLLACLERGDTAGVLDATSDLGDTLAEVRSMIDSLRGLAHGSRSGGEEQVRISETVGRIARLRDRFGGARVDYVDDGGGCLVAELDRADLERAITNLVRNAEEATSEAPEGGVVRLRLASASNGFAELHVEDNGPGIPADVRARVFDPLFSSKSGSGTGLGLAQVNALAVRTGGSVDVAESALGGADVTLRIPAVDVPAFDRADASGAERRGAAPSAPPVAVDERAPRVLLVDDNRAVRRTLARALERRGWHVALAESGDEARGRIEDGLVPSLVITDVTMPGTLDGVGLARWLASTHPSIPVIVMSAYAFADQVPGCLFLEKPVTDQRLEEAARSVMARP